MEQAHYPNSLQLCLTFWEGLHTVLMDCLNNLAEGRPVNVQINSWYRVAWDQWQLMELKCDLCQAALPAMATHLLVSTLHFQAFPMLDPLLTSLLVRPLVRPALSPKVPMDVDASCQRAALPLLCHQCGAPGHFAQWCPLGLEVWFLTPEEQEELLLQLLAAQDSTGVLSPNAAAQDSHDKEVPGTLVTEGASEGGF
ncbi:hypothetical protein C0992_007108 [Termitomyces sp. T32_za158]|nr:hypothetical protein C0992_007108 [Termitomyces sp. T32_za158]